MTNELEIKRLRHKILSMLPFEERMYIQPLLDKCLALAERQQGEWTPISVQKPDVGGSYLVTAKIANGYRCIDIGRHISKDIWTFGGDEIPDVEIIAWQPTPEPYKESENE